MKLKLAAIVVAVMVVTAVAIAAIDAFVPTGSQPLFRAVTSGVLVLAAGFAAFSLRRRYERQTLSAAPDSVEAELVRRAQAGTMIDTLLVGLALALVFLVSHNLGGMMGVLLLVVIVLVDYSIRYSLLLRRTKVER